MNLVVVTALLAVCAADKLDRTYLPPASATTAGGNQESLQTPFKTFNLGLGGLPKGSYSNDFEGVVVDAAAPGTRASGADETGLGGPRITYGSTDSKVGDAAFTADAAFPRVGINSGLNTQGAYGAANNQQNLESRPERIQSSRDRVSNTVKYENEVSPDKFNYAFETDNGIVAEENGIEVNGVKAQGGFSYTGDDGQVYSVTYTADEEGYRPTGNHLPTPPPIPVEILESLEKNAQDEAAGIIDDGSYDAQKYNTGEDYTKSENGQYNSEQSIQYGNRPQSDAVASGSFIRPNNQGFGKPNSQKFSSTSSSLDASQKNPSNGNNFGTISGAIIPAQNTQEFGIGVGPKNEYLPPTNVFSQNRKPALNGLQNIQSGTPSGFPISSSTSSNDNTGFNKNQNQEIPVFTPLSQQKLQEDSPKRPSNSPVFGKPTVIDSTLSIKDPFTKRPSSNRFTQNRQPNQQPQAIGGSFEVVSGSVYSSNNEYLPPRRQSNKPNQNNGYQPFQGTSSKPQPNKQFSGSQIFSPNSPSSSAFASVTHPLQGHQSSQQHSGQHNPHYSQNYNSRPLNQEQQPTFSFGVSKVPSFNRSPGSQSQYRPSIFASQTPTLQPQSELTNPLESNSVQNKNTAPIPIIDGPDSPSLASSVLPSFSSQPLNNFLGQHLFNINKIQQASPTQSSASVVSTLSDTSITPGFQNFPESGRPTGNNEPQVQPTNVPVNGQYSFSSQRPSFNQYNQQQGPDDSYHYNKPSKPFGTPTPRPQASIYPSTSFDQTSKVTQTPFGGRPQLSNASPTAFTSQSNTPADATRYPKPSTLGPISPTLPTQQDGQNSNTFQTQFNKVTQASTSSFPSPTPSASVSNGGQYDQLGMRPLQSVNPSNQANHGFNQQQSSSQPQQQYGGEIYEYKKPPQTLTTPQNGAAFKPVEQTSQLGPLPSSPQTTQSTATYRPSFQFGSKVTQQPFGQTPLNSQVTQGFDDNHPAQTQQKPGQFNFQPLNPNQNSQPIQGASKFPPTYNQEGPPCCKQLPSPTQSSQADKQDGSPQFISQFRPNQGLSQQGSDLGVKPGQAVSTFAGVGETFGGPRKPPSFDETGYHY